MFLLIVIATTPPLLLYPIDVLHNSYDEEFDEVLEMSHLYTPLEIFSAFIVGKSAYSTDHMG